LKAGFSPPRQKNRQEKKAGDSHLQQIGRTGQHTSRRLWNWFCLTGAAPFEAGDLFGDVVKKRG